jgi:hypothetical protein
MVLPVPVAATSRFRRQLLEHVLLVGLGLQVEEADRHRHVAAEAFAPECLGQGLPVARVIRVVSLELAVGPERFEVGCRTLEECLLRPLRQLHGPFEPTRKGCAGQVGASNVGRSETAAPVE